MFAVFLTYKDTQWARYTLVRDPTSFWVRINTNPDSVHLRAQRDEKERRELQRTKELAD